MILKMTNDPVIARSPSKAIWIVAYLLSPTLPFFCLRYARAIGTVECIFGVLAALIAHIGLVTILAATDGDPLQIFVILLLGLSLFVIILWQFLAGQRVGLWSDSAQKQWRTAGRFFGGFLAVGMVLAIVTFHLQRNLEPSAATPPPVRPTPPITCNAIWPMPYQTGHGDTVVVTRCRGADEYAKTSAGKDWNYHWYLVSTDVLSVERGAWIEKNVTFVYPDPWPTPESGIMLNKVDLPFAKGRIFALTLITSAKPATVMAYERRSYVAPHGPLRYIHAKPGMVEPASDLGRIMRAVAEFETTHDISVQKAVTETPEDAGDSWIVHRRDGWSASAGSWLYRVNKTTFTVQATP